MAIETHAEVKPVHQVSPLSEVLHDIDLRPPTGDIGPRQDEPARVTPAKFTVADNLSPYDTAILKLSIEGASSGAAFDRAAGYLTDMQILKNAYQPRPSKTLPTKLTTGKPFPPGLIQPPVYTDGLSAKQLEIVLLAAMNLTNEEAAAALGITPSGVRRRLVSVEKKWGTPARINLIGIMFGFRPPPGAH